MTTPPTSPDPDAVAEAPDAGAEGHDTPPELLEGEVVEVKDLEQLNDWLRFLRRRTHWSRVHVRGAAREEGKLRGMTLAGAYVDEATLVPLAFWRQLLNRLSVPGARLFATTNPDSPHHWLLTDYRGRPGSLAAMTTPPTSPDPDAVAEAPDAGAEGHDTPPELLEVHGLLELANAAELDAAREAFA